jgi:acyl carrier protein
MSTDPTPIAAECTSPADLFNEVVAVIRSSVNLQHIDPSSFKPETSLREGGLELDSVDILEIIVAMEHRFGVKVDDAETGKKYFRTVGSITELIQMQKA